jgi:hypothetical protein
MTSKVSRIRAAQLGHKFGGFLDGEAAKKRWNYLRDYYVKTKNRRVASGSAATDGEASTWPYFGMMAFLDGTLEPRKGYAVPNPSV